MNTKETKSEFRLHVVGHLLSVVCLGALALICSSVQAQNLFVSSDAAGGNIYEFTPNGVRSTFASGPRDAGALAFDKAGNLFVTSDNIYKFTPRGERTKFASGPAETPACDSEGDLFVSTGDTDLYEFPINGSGKVYKITRGGVRSIFASGLDLPTALGFDSEGNLFVANVRTVEKDRTFSGAIYKFTPSGVRTTFALLHNPEALAFDSAGNLFVADPNPGTGAIYKFTPGGVPSTFASGFSWAGSLACDSEDNLFVADSPVYSIYKFTPDGVRSTFATTDGVNLLAFQPGQAAPTPTPTPTPVLTPTPTPTPTPTVTPAVPAVSLKASPPNVNKGGTATFTAAASMSDPFDAMLVNFSTSGNAVNGTDYTLSANQITIPAGQSTGSVTLQVTTAKPKGREKAIMTLQPGTGYTVATGKKANTAKVIIHNK